MEGLSKVIIFQLKEQSYGVDVQQIMSIEKLSNVTEVPKTSDFIKGVINLRGEIIPIIYLKERLQLGSTKYTENTRVLIVNLNSVQLGLVVDAATDVIDLEPSVVEKAPNLVGGVDSSFLKGVAKLGDNLLILLDLKHVLNFEELNEVKEVTKV